MRRSIASVSPFRSRLAAAALAGRNKNVRYVELAWGAAISAEWAYFVALGVFAYHAGGASAVGLAGLIRLLPAAFIAPPESFRRKRPSCPAGKSTHPMLYGRNG